MIGNVCKVIRPSRTTDERPTRRNQLKPCCKVQFFYERHMQIRFPPLAWLTVLHHHHHRYWLVISPGEWWPSLPRAAAAFPSWLNLLLLFLLYLSDHYSRVIATQIKPRLTNRNWRIEDWPLLLFFVGLLLFEGEYLIRVSQWFDHRQAQRYKESGSINYELQIMEISNLDPVRREYHFLPPQLVPVPS